MSHPPKDPAEPAAKPSAETAATPATPGCATGRMHENVPDWSDPCCSCEAEPYWLAIADEVENDSDKAPD